MQVNKPNHHKTAYKQRSLKNFCYQKKKKMNFRLALQYTSNVNSKKWIQFQYIKQKEPIKFALKINSYKVFKAANSPKKVK